VIEKVRTGRRMLIGLTLLFMAPLGTAFWLYYGTGWRPAATINHGELIAPVRALPESALTRRADGAQLFHDRKWSLVVVSNDGCGTDCQSAIRNVRLMLPLLGRLQARTQVVLLNGAPCCNAGLESLGYRELIKLDATAAPELLRTFPEAQRAQMIFIVDPLGNLMMRYDSREDPRGLREDLKRLLDLSQIG
jgi:hypothetical protein